MKKALFFIAMACLVVAVMNSCHSGANQKKEEVHKDSVVAKSTIQEFEFEKSISVSGTVYELPYENGAGTQMKTYILALSSPINVISKSTEYESQTNVEEIQIGFSDNVTNPELLIDKKITVTGVVYANQTIHDHRPVVMVDAEIKK